MGSWHPEHRQPSVTLPQGTVLGLVLEDEHLYRPVEAFRGIPYALPPTGDRRFRRPVRVPRSSDTIDASKFGYAAPSKPLLVPTLPLEYSEDCLTVNVFRQEGISSDKLLPVLVYVHGGAFNRGSSSMHNTASMVSWSEQPFVAVSFNYRVGSLGFLPSRISAKEGALNLGLWDQVLLFEWVQENIEAFGGDKHNITLAGLSAGAHSIGHHILRHTESNPGPFQRAIMESGAPTSRAVRQCDAEIHEQQFREYLQQLDCPSNMEESQIFPFLRSLPTEKIIQAQNHVFDKYNPSLRWAFQPVIDGELIRGPPLEVWRSGNYQKIPIMTGFNGNEGSLYVNKQMSQPSEFRDFFQTLLPRLSEDDLTKIESLYPDPSLNQDKTYELSPSLLKSGQVSSQYPRIEAAYGQYAYVAPTRQTAQLASSTPNHPPVYLYHWAPKTTIVGGASHGDNMKYSTFNSELVGFSKTQRQLAAYYHGYVTSFICNGGNPNVTSEKSIAGTRPVWEPYRTENPKTMVFGKGNEERIGGGVGVIAECVDDTWGKEQCEFWWEKVGITQQ